MSVEKTLSANDVINRTTKNASIAYDHKTGEAVMFSTARVSKLVRVEIYDDKIKVFVDTSIRVQEENR